MKPARFAYARARNATEALEMAATAGDDARFLAGGQSLTPMMNFRLVRPSALIDLCSCADLDFVRYEAGYLHIGAMTRQRSAETDATVRLRCPLLVEALKHAGPAAVRNRATIGGSIANGYPIAELPVVALCLDAEMVLISRRRERRVPASDFFIAGMVTAIEPQELLREVVIPIRPQDARFKFAERGNHAGGSALAIVAACADSGVDSQRLSRLSMAAAGLRSVPVRLVNVEAALQEGATNVRSAFEADLNAIEASGHGGELEDQSDLVWALVEDVIRSLRSGGEVHT